MDGFPCLRVIEGFGSPSSMTELLCNENNTGDLSRIKQTRKDSRKALLFFFFWLFWATVTLRRHYSDSCEDKVSPHNPCDSVNGENSFPLVSCWTSHMLSSSHLFFSISAQSLLRRISLTKQLSLTSGCWSGHTKSLLSTPHTHTYNISFWREKKVPLCFYSFFSYVAPPI